MVIVLHNEGFTIKLGTYILNGNVYTVQQGKIYRTTPHNGTSVLYPVKAGLYYEVDIIELKGLIRAI